MKNNNGNILTISLIFIAGVVVVVMLLIAIFISHVNNILYRVKIDMYSMNRAAVVAVNKNKTNTDSFSYNKKAYKNEFIKMLKQNYELDDALRNDEKLITSVELKEYEVYAKGKKDSYTKERTDDRTIHTVLKVKIKPIILRDILEDVLVFNIHEDVNLNMMNEV